MMDRRKVVKSMLKKTNDFLEDEYDLVVKKGTDEAFAEILAEIMYGIEKAYKAIEGIEE